MHQKIIFSLLVVLIACSERDGPVPVIQSDLAGINLADLQVGQKSYYLKYSGKCSGEFSLSGDTLIVEVVAEGDDLFLRESFSPGSLTSNTFTHKILDKDSYLLLPERFSSSLFNYYGNDTLFLEKETTVTLIQDDCLLRVNDEVFTGEEIGSIDNFRFGQILIENKKGISCIPLIYNLDGFLLYDEYLSLSHTVQDGFVNGFVAIQLE